MSELMSDSKSQHCRVVHTTDASYRSVSPLPPGYLKTLQAANQDLLHSPDTPALVRKVAKCVHPAIGAEGS
jgi:hypothetical protein